MSEVEFDRMLDAVRAAVAPVPQEDFLPYASISNRPPRAANASFLFPMAGTPPAEQVATNRGSGHPRNRTSPDAVCLKRRMRCSPRRCALATIGPAFLF